MADIQSATAELKRGKKIHRKKKKAKATRMWADAQRDGRPAEYRWRPLFNTASLADTHCWSIYRAVTLPRRESR